MYKRLTTALLHTREDFSKVCKQLSIDPEWADPRMLDAVMCDNCGYWETPSKASTINDTVYCRVCSDIENQVF